MLPITTMALMRVMPRAGDLVTSFIGPINQAMARWEIVNLARVAPFLAEAAHESGELRHLEESLNYSAEALVCVWPNRFTLESAAAIARNPEAIANAVYANRLGNGPAESGDGYRYRGRGIFQLTGRANYRECSIAIAGDADTLLVNPELLATPEYACESAGWFWKKRGLNELADRGDFEAITKHINGGLIGLADRTAYWRRALVILAYPE